ncbi:MAG: phenylalanine--tRNA ligase subunit beta [bacterium]
MKLPLSWLKEYVKTKYSAEEIADKLTMAGLEVEEIIREVVFSGVVIGEVIAKEKHPNADKLNIAKVNVGKKSLQIVCGAPNLAVGQMVPVALVGAKLGDFEISKAVLRGVESNGMICSERELGISDEHEGIMVLEKEVEVGGDFGEYLGKDEVIDVKVLANRPDCMSILGLAREVSALTSEKLVEPKVNINEVVGTEKIVVRVEDSSLCPRYVSRIVKNVKLVGTPKWMKERLLASGVRSIDLFVDISNYVMLEYGQPLHFFDLDKLTDRSIIVRSAKEGETLVTLDGQNRNLTKDNLVIANKKIPIALAGVMGGETTEISKDTKNIFIEAAVFDKASIRKTSRALGLRSEAVARFEKGISLDLPDIAIDRAAQLLTELGLGEVQKGKNDVSDGATQKLNIIINPSKLNAFLGTSYSNKEIVSTLTSLGFKVSEKTKYSLDIVIPWWRVDILEPVDIYEEVVRIIGYESVPSTLPFAVAVIPQKNQFFEFSQVVRNTMVGAGFTEIMTYSFAGEKEIGLVSADAKEALEVANPLVKEQKYLRTSLVPKMLESLAANQFNRDSLHLFEIAKTYHKNGKDILPKEKTILSIGVVGGTAWPFNSVSGANFYDCKGTIQNLLKNLKIQDDLISYRPARDSLFAIGHSCELFYKDKVIGQIGVISVSAGNISGLKKAAATATIDLNLLYSLLPQVDQICAEISKYQKSVRDISVTVPKNISAETVLDATRNADGLIQSIDIIDIYEGKNINSDEKNITIRLEIFSFEKTLTEKDVDNTVKICQNILIMLGGKLRGVEK